MAATDQMPKPNNPLAMQEPSIHGPRSCQWWCHWSEPHWRRRARRFMPPCLRAFHSPSPSTLMPPRRFARSGGAYRRDVHQAGPRALRPAIRVQLQGLLAAARRAEVRHNPVQADQPQQALDQPSSPWSLGRVAFPWLDLPERHAEQPFHRKAGPDRSSAIVRLSTALASRRGLPRS